MNSRFMCCFAVVCLAAGLAYPVRAAAQEYRTSVKVPVVTVYEGMLKFASAGQFDKVENSITLVKPVLDKLKEKFGVNLEKELVAAIAARKTPETTAKVLKTIYWDMHDIFSLIREEKGQKNALKSWLKMSLVDYWLLSPSVIKSDKAANDRVLLLFKEAAAELEKTEADIAQTDRIFKGIEKECLLVFPEFAR